MAANDFLNDKRFIVWLDLEMTGLTINTTEAGKRDDEASGEGEEGAGGDSLVHDGMQNWEGEVARGRPARKRAIRGPLALAAAKVTGCDISSSA